MADIEVNIGEIAITKNADTLVASGVGSCLVITLYDPKNRIGGLAHAMLPSSVNRHSYTKNCELHSTSSVDVAIDEMLKRIETCGAKGEDLEAKLIGGANMFSAFASDIGMENVLSAKDKLKKEGIKIIGESVGGSQGRSVEFSVASGIVTIKMKF